MKWAPRLGLCLVTWLVLGHPVLTNAQVAMSEGSSGGLPPVAFYGKKNYQAADNNFDILPDHRGLMYFANGFGVLEFDGTDWTLIRNSKSSTVYSLCLDTLGVGFANCTNRIYVGSLGDIGYLACDSVGTLAYSSLLGQLPEEARNIGTVWTTRVYPGGVVFHSNEALYILRDGKFEIIRPEFRETAFGFHWTFCVGDQLFITERGKGLHELKSTGLEFVSNSEPFGSEKIWGMFPGDQGDISLVTRERGLVGYDGHQFSSLVHPVNKMLKENPPYFMAEHNGIKAIMTAQTGLLILNSQDSLLYHLTREMGGLPDDDITNVSFGRDGNIWLALQNGVCRIQFNSPFSYFDETAGISGLISTSLMHEGDLLVGTSEGLFSKDWSPPKHHTSADWHFSEPFQESGNVNGLTKVGQSLFVSGVNGVFLKNSSGDNFRHIIRGKRSYSVEPFREDPRYLLGAAGDALFMMQNLNATGESPRWVFRSNIKGTGEHKFIAQDSEGYIWGNQLSGGFVKMKFNEEKDEVTRIEYFNDAHGIPASSINKVYELGGEVVFTTEEGFYRFNHKQNTFYSDTTLNAALGDRTYVYGMTAGIEDVLWVWAAEGTADSDDPILHQLVPQDDGSYRAVTAKFLPLRKNFVSSSHHINPLDDGSVIFGGSSGLIHYNAMAGTSADPKFEVMLRKVEIIKPSREIIYGNSWNENSRSPFISTEIHRDQSIGYEQNSLRFTFAAPFYEEPEKNQFQYRLEGYEDRWSDWTIVHNKEYSNLSEGQYTFHLRARNLFEVETDEVTYHFTISPPWYRHRLAYLGYLLLAVGLISAIVRVNVRRLQAAKRRLEDLVVQRTTEIRAQKEEISAQAAELQETNEKLIEMDEFKQGLTSMIVHDLKNPLNSLLNTSEVYSKDQQIVTMKQSASQMLTMVQNILDVDKYEEAKMALQWANHDLYSLTKLAIEQVKFLAKQGVIEVRNEIAVGFGVRVDAEVVMRLLVNLMTNAIKYTPRNGLVTISAQAQGVDFVRVQVTDTGEGIPANKIDQVFAKFGQVVARKSGGVKSTGLGLTFCKLAAEAHGGQIGVETEEGQGSEFWFSVPSALLDVSAVKTNHVNADPIAALPPLQFSAEELEKYTPIALELNDIPLYRVSNLRRILKQVKGSGTVELWRDQLLLAIKSGDEKEFERLLNIILNESK